MSQSQLLLGFFFKHRGDLRSIGKSCVVISVITGIYLFNTKYFWVNGELNRFEVGRVSDPIFFSFWFIYL